MSCYDPSVLFSDCTLQIRTALTALYQTPQNNFKISSSSGSVFNNEKSNLKDREEIDAILQVFLSDSNTKIKTCDSSHTSNIENGINLMEEKQSSTIEKSFESSGVTDIIDVLTCILKSESVLRDIFSLQSVDILDVEGRSGN